MKSRHGSIFAEVITVCFITAIIVPAVVSIILCSTALIETSKDTLLLERAREEILSGLAGGRPLSENIAGKGGCNVTLVSSSDSYVKLKISRDGFKKRSESFVIWPQDQEK